MGPGYWEVFLPGRARLFTAEGGRATVTTFAGTRVELDPGDTLEVDRLHDAGASFHGALERLDICAALALARPRQA